MSANVFLSKEAVKTLDRVDCSTEKRLRACLKNLKIDPAEKGKPFKGLAGLRAVRVGDWRVLYTCKEDSVQVYIIAIRPLGRLKNDDQQSLVEDLLEERKAEIYYILLRRISGEKAKRVIETILLGERINLVDAGWARIKKAAEIKSGSGLSYADSFVLALGFEKRATVVTGDRKIIAQAEQLNIDVLSI